MMTVSMSLSNYRAKSENMQLQINDIIEYYLEKNFASHTVLQQKVFIELHSKNLQNLQELGIIFLYRNY
ncbi:MAG: hypothetical protein COA77_10840 [Thaumarchaeota archaeon]|nr:MAG: hypothetical protein COA77_10840 [Nitrososphaerota archaeon]